jgi:hypothetical protein
VVVYISSLEGLPVHVSEHGLCKVLYQKVCPPPLSLLPHYLFSPPAHQLDLCSRTLVEQIVSVPGGVDVVWPRSYEKVSKGSLTLDGSFG